MRLARVADVDTGTLRGDWLSWPPRCSTCYAGDASRVALRLGLEAGAIPGVAEHYAQMRHAQVLAAPGHRAARHRPWRDPPDTSVTLLLDTLIGGAMMHAMVTPDDRRADLARSTGAYAAQLVKLPAPRRHPDLTAAGPGLCL